MEGQGYKNKELDEDTAEFLAVDLKDYEAWPVHHTAPDGVEYELDIEKKDYIIQVLKKILRNLF